MSYINVAQGLVLCFAWYYTIIAGFFLLYCPILSLAFVTPLIYQKIVDVYFELWQLYPVVLFQWIYGTKIRLLGDYIDAKETSILIMNHRTRVDWNFAWLALYNASKIKEDKYPVISAKKSRPNKAEICDLKEFLQINKLLKDEDHFRDLCISDYFSSEKASLKLVLKDGIKSLPGIGWIMQMNNFLYLKRNWSEDHENIMKFLKYYNHLKLPYQLLIFPEGTDLSKANQRKGYDYARRKNLQSYDYVLHPRIRGFATIAANLQMTGDLNAVYDMTIVYRGKIPQTEMDLALGNIPEHVIFTIKRYEANILPKSVEGLGDWLTDKWREKENYLSFLHSYDNIPNNTPTAKSSNSRVLRTAFCFWTAVDFIFLFAILSRNVFFQFWLLFNSFMFILITSKFGGFHIIFMKYFLLKL